MRMCLWTYNFSFFISKFLGLLGHMLNVCLTLQATNKLISKVSCPTSDKWEFCCLTSTIALVLPCILVLASLIGYPATFYWGFNLDFFMTSNVVHLFMCLFATLYLFWWSVSSIPLLIFIVCFLTIELRVSLTFINPLIQHMFLC